MGVGRLFGGVFGVGLPILFFWKKRPFTPPPPALFGQAQSKPPAFVKVMYWGGVQNVRDHGKILTASAAFGKTLEGFFFEPFQGPLECSPNPTNRKFKEVNIHKNSEKILNRPG